MLYTQTISNLMSKIILENLAVTLLLKLLLAFYGNQLIFASSQQHLIDKLRGLFYGLSSPSCLVFRYLFYFKDFPKNCI